MPGNTKEDLHVVHGIRLKGPWTKQKIEPYNKFSIQFTVTKTRIDSENVKTKESDRTLLKPELLGLNPVWLHTRRAPVDQVTTEDQKVALRKLHLKFPYWGHLIYNSIKKFNASSPHRCRKFVYDLRHGEADHNAWKKVFGKIDPLLWTEVKRNSTDSRIDTKAYSD